MKPQRESVDMAVSQAGAPRIRRLKPDEWPGFRAIRLRALRDSPDAFGSTLDREAAFADEEWQARANPADGAVFVADGPNDLVGMAIGAPAPGNPGSAAVFGMWVAPGSRRLGLGGALIEAIKGWAIDAGYPRLGLGVTITNAPAIALYQRLGFVATGERYPLRAGADLMFQIMAMPLSREGPTVADCERLQTRWFLAGATLNGGMVWHGGPLTWTWHPYDGHVMLLFPRVIPTDDLERGLARVAELNPRIVGAWLSLDVDPANLATAGFERGWAPWWMTAPIDALGPTGDDRVRLETDTPEYDNPDDVALLALARLEPHRTWHAAARVDGRLAGHGWAHLDGDVAGIFQMTVWPGFRRRGLGTGIVRALGAATGAAGARHLVLNATPEGERLYSSVGFQRIGDGITWWLHGSTWAG